LAYRVTLHKKTGPMFLSQVGVRPDLLRFADKQPFRSSEQTDRKIMKAKVKVKRSRKISGSGIRRKGLFFWLTPNVFIREPGLNPLW
jgi:hypothetical protein